MIPNPPKNTIELIGETFPYLFENADKIVFNQNVTEIPLNKSFDSFEKENFTDLVQILSTLGSLNLANELKASGRNFFLGEKLRIRKISHDKPSGLLTAKVTAQIQNEQKGKALLEVQNANSKLFQMELDYYIIEEEAFKQIFESHYHAENIDNLTTTLPTTSIEYLSENEYNIIINEFSRSHCFGHFNNYEIVPAVFMAKCILKNIFEMFPDMEIDNMEVFLNKAMPINTTFKANVKKMNLSRNLTKYKCTVTDNKTEYGHYFLTLKN